MLAKGAITPKTWNQDVSIIGKSSAKLQADWLDEDAGDYTRQQMYEPRKKPRSFSVS